MYICFSFKLFKIQDGRQNAVLNEHNLFDTYIFYVHGLIHRTKYANQHIFVSENEEEIKIYFCLF